MNVILEYTGQLRTVSGRSEESLVLPDGATIAAMAAWLSERCSEAARAHLLTAAGELQPSLLIALNGIAQPARQAARMVLHDGDRVILLPPIAGG